MDLIKKIEQLVLPLFDDLKLELVDMEYRREPQGWVLRFFLDKDGGITLDDCADASRQISSLLDVEDIIPNAFNLEVSSPGMERPLKKPADFERFSGKKAKIKTVDAIDPQATGKRRKTFVGTLSGVDQHQVVLLLAEPGSTEVRISFQNIDMAHLVLDF